jgi:hypothetical protein
MTIARTVVAPAYGGPDQLEVREVEVPAPGSGEVTIEVRAAGVNPVDFKLISGVRGADPEAGRPRGRGSARGARWTLVSASSHSPDRGAFWQDLGAASLKEESAIEVARQTPSTLAGVTPGQPVAIERVAEAARR